MDEIHDDADPGADEDVVDDGDGHIEDLVKAEAGQILLGHVDGGENTARDDENAPDAVVAGDEDEELHETENQDAVRLDRAVVVVTDDDISEDADELDAESGWRAENDVLDAGEEIDEGIECDKGFPAVGLGAGDIRK